LEVSQAAAAGVSINARIFAAAAAGIGSVPQGPSQHIEILLSSRAPP